MQPFLALITPLGDTQPPSVGQPPGIWPSPGYPAHPIAPGGPPPGIWPSPGHPAHPIVIVPPGAIAPGVPAHPIYLPIGIWGGSGQPFPEHPMAPGGMPPGIWPSPGYPAHPIAPGGPPPTVWPGPGRPAHPIELPPDTPGEPPTEPPTSPEDPHWVWGWNQAQGWHPVYVPQPGEPGPK